MKMKSIPTLTPAYGKDYKSARDAVAAYKNGVDWRFNLPGDPNDGKYCSIRDLGNQEVYLRYDRMQTVVRIQAESDEER